MKPPASPVPRSITVGQMLEHAQTQALEPGASRAR